jgi:hypothetical protein
MTDTQVHIELLPPVKLYLPGPQAKRAGNALRDIHQTAAAALQAMRHSAEADHDAIALEVMADRLHELTRAARRAERAHIARWSAEVQTRDIGLDTTEEPDNEPSPERDT